MTFYAFLVQLRDRLQVFPAFEIDFDLVRANLDKDVQDHLSVIEAIKHMPAPELQQQLDAIAVADAEEANPENTNG